MHFAGLRETRLLTRGASSAAMMLWAGGDERIAVDPTTGRNRYGVAPSPAPEEIWFSSSTASAISPAAFGAVEAAYDRVMSSGTKASNAPHVWFDTLRARIERLVGSPGAKAILCASGTEAELLALSLSRHLLRRPLANLVVAQAETGVGVMQAAAGVHFNHSAALRPTVQKGRQIEGLTDQAIEACKVDIRDADGRLRTPVDVDAEVNDVVLDAIDSGRDVLLHVLDTSKTGHGGPSRGAANALADRYPANMVVVVDACQLRCSFESIRADLDAGFLVMITGSKFAGGPPFSGALLVPSVLVDRLRDLKVPSGLAGYSARYDWPESMRSALEGDFTAFNLSLGLRWEAALVEMEAFSAVWPGRRHVIAQAFGERVRRLVADSRHLHFLDPDIDETEGRTPTIHSILSGNGDPTEALAIHKALREPIVGATQAADGLSRICHLGQPVVIGHRAALRVCISMPMIAAISGRMDRSRMSDAFATTDEDLGVVFRKWDALQQGVAR